MFHEICQIRGSYQQDQKVDTEYEISLLHYRLLFTFIWMFKLRFMFGQFDWVHGLCGVSINISESFNPREKKTSMTIGIFDIVVSSAVSSGLPSDISKKQIRKGTWRLFTDEQNNCQRMALQKLNKSCSCTMHTKKN